MFILKSKGRRPGITFYIKDDGVLRKEKLHRGVRETKLLWKWITSISTENTDRKFRRIVGVLGGIFVLAGALLLISSIWFSEVNLTDLSSLTRPLSGFGLAVLGGVLLRYTKPRTEWQIHMDIAHTSEEELFRGKGKDFADEIKRRLG